MPQINMAQPTVEALLTATEEFKYKLQHITSIYYQVVEVHSQHPTATPMTLQGLWTEYYWRPNVPVLDTDDICRLVTLYGIGSRSPIPSEYVLQDIVTEMYLNAIKRNL